MKRPHLHLAVFKSRIGKRIFAMFVGCSFLPIILLAAISYWRVEHQLKEQAAARLHQTTKGIGMSIYERLEFLEGELMYTVQQFREEASAFGPRDVAPVEDRLQRFDGIRLQSVDGRSIPLHGRIDAPPGFTAAEMKELRAGRTHIRIIARQDLPARIQMSRWTALRGQPSGILVGEVNTAYLWGIGRQSNLPPATELTVVDRSGRLLISSLPRLVEGTSRATAPLRDTGTRHFVWQTREHTYLSSYWDLFLKSRFAADTWTIVLSQTREDALSVIRRYKVDFPLVLLVVFWLILLISIRFIRRSLVPLETLREATRRIHDGDFTQSVTLSSGDEFEDLAASFNVMTDRLSRTFGELSVMAEMGRFVTTRPEVVDLVETQLRIMGDRLHFDWGVLMVHGDVLCGKPVIAGFGLSRKTDRPHDTIARLDGDARVHRLMMSAVHHEDVVFTPHVTELAPLLPPGGMELLRRIGCHSLLCVPVESDNRPLGVLAVGTKTGGPPLTDSDKNLLIGIAAQTAVAIDSVLAYHQLESSEARFREAFDHAATGIALVTDDFRIRASNRYLQQLLRYSEAELCDRSLEDIAMSEDRAVGAEEVGLMLAGDLRFAQYEKRYRRKDGEAVWVRVNASLMRDTSGAPRQFIFHIRDLTAEKLAESDKRRLEGQLRQAQKMEAIGTLAGGIAHDFNNILSAVSGYTELALMQLPPDADVRDNLARVGQAADRATHLVRQILAFSRRTEQEKIPIQISTIVKEALQLLRASLPATIDIRKTIDSAAPPVMADPTQIHQIVMNLCTNAMHAMQATGGMLEVRLEQVSLPEDVRRTHRIEAGDYLRLAVADSGCGMDGSTRERIFDPYFTTKEKGKGTGLGLAVVHGIVESHKGAIEVSSTLGEGTRFDVYLPVAEDRPCAVQSAAEGNRRGSERVLFVDDEPMLVEIGKALLGNLGYEVVGLTDPHRALEVFQQAPDRFDLVITDLTMPGITGDRLAAMLTAVRSDLPILLCSGYMPPVEHPCLAGTIHKPVRLQELSRAVRTALDRAANKCGRPS